MTTPSAWYPVALSSDIDPGTANGTRLLGREIVVWRDSAGTVHVWDDRCPHRGMRLSFGFVRGDRMACLYHGWQYDTAGQCRYVPAHPDLVPPATIRVPVLASAERLGMIWTRADDPAGEEPLPDERTVHPVRSIAIDGAPESAAARLLRDAGPPCEDGGGDGWHASALSPSLVVLRSRAHAVLIGIQPLSQRECALHTSVTGSGAGRARVSRWLEALRGSLETDGAG